jgi:Tol biopolymer transport system component
VEGVKGELAVGLYTLSLISLDGGFPRSLGVHTPSFAWSPDGQKIAYIQWDDLWVMDVDTGETENLTKTPDQFEFRPKWSPNGKLIAFYSMSVRLESYELALVENNGANYRLVDAQPVAGFSWSPDSKQLAYAVNGELIVFSLPDGLRRPLILTDYGLQADLCVCSPAWSPQGDAIAIFFSTRPAPEEKSAQKGYAILDLADHTVRILKSYTMTETMAYEGIPSGEHVGGCDQPPALWNPSGEWLLLTILPVPRTNVDGSFWLIDVEGGQEHRLGSVYGAYAADWSPDGKWIAYIDLGDRLVYILDPFDPQGQPIAILPSQLPGGHPLSVEGLDWRPK